MLESLLRMFTTAEKAEAMLESPIIRMLFMALFALFAIALIIHMAVYMRLRFVRNHIKSTQQLDVEPVKTFKEQYIKLQQSEAVHVDTFVQERFSSWRLFQTPVVNVIKLVQMTVSVFILLGVLGTFIGLTISLGHVNTAGDQIVENISAVLSGIDVAFYTSILGMSFSLIMTVLVKVFNTEFMLTDIMLMTESLLSEDDNHHMGRLIHVSENVHDAIIKLQGTHEQSLQGIIDAFSGFKNYTDGLQQAAHDLSAFNHGLADNLKEFQSLFENMQTVTKGFQEGTSALNKNFSTLFNYLKRNDERQERMAKSFENSYEKMAETTDQQVDAFKQFAQISDQLEQFMESMIDEQQTIHHSFERITEEQTNVAKTIDQHNETFKNIFGSDLQRPLKDISAHLGDLSSEFDKLGQSFVKLPDALDVIEQTQQQYRHLLSDRFQDLEAFNERFSDHLDSHTHISTQFEQQLKEATSSYQQIALKNSQLIQDMNVTLSKMDQSYNQRDQHLEASVGILKDTLASYVANVEGTLSDRLNQIIRQISESMSQTSQGIQREFLDLRRGAEDMQQNQFRVIQQLLQEVGRELQEFNRNLNTVQHQRPVANQRIGWGPHDT